MHALRVPFTNARSPSPIPPFDWFHRLTELPRIPLFSRLYERLQHRAWLHLLTVYRLASHLFARHFLSNKDARYISLIQVYDPHSPVEVDATTTLTLQTSKDLLSITRTSFRVEGGTML